MSQINTVDITSKQLHGTGVFDELMTTINFHLLVIPLQFPMKQKKHLLL
jgi:hypothetical protein